MKNFWYILVFMLFAVSVVNAQKNNVLKFDKKGEFKIVQFTDTHVDLPENKNLQVFETIKNVLKVENPDLVVLTGDIVTQDNPQEAYLVLVHKVGDFSTFSFPEYHSG